MISGNKNHSCVRGRGPLVVLALAVFFLIFVGCGSTTAEKWQPLVHTSSGEHYWLVKDIFLTPGSASTRKEAFDHNMHESVNLFFIPKDERNHYVAESRWFDPSGQEYRTIRTTYDQQQEAKKGQEREKNGTTRLHSMSTKELVNHKPGMWKVELFLSDKLVRRLSFSVR